jgi:CHAT domain-containing protein
MLFRFACALLLTVFAGPIRGTVEDGRTTEHALTATAGEFVRLRVERDRADIAVTVRDPTGRAIVETDTDVFPPGGVTVSFVAAATGPHLVQVALKPAGRATGYTITVRDQRPADTDDSARVAAERAYQDAERGRLRATGESQRAALSDYERARETARRLGDRALEADALTGASRIHDALNDKTAALKGLDEALALDIALGRLAAAAWVHNFRCLVLESTGDRAGALAAAEKARATAREAGDLRSEGVAVQNLGFVNYALGNRTRTLELYDEALPLHRAAGNPRAEANTLTGMGATLDYLGEKARALGFLQQALAIRRVLGEPKEMAIVLNNIGVLHFSIDEMASAFAIFGQALEQWRRSGDGSGEAATLHNVARVHEAVGDFQEALKLWDRSLRLFRAAGARPREANALTRIGQVYAHLGDYRQALSLYEQALVVHRATGNRPFEADTLAQMGSLYAAEGDHARALDLLSRALALQRDVKDPRGQSVALHEMARSHLARSEAAAARPFLEEALALYRAISNRRGEAAVRASQAEAELIAGNLVAARLHAEDALALARALSSPREEGAALRALTRVERDSGDLEAARGRAEEAIERIEAVRLHISGQDLRASFVAAMRDHYELLVDVLMRLHRAHPDRGFDGAALEASERARARSLLESLSEARAWIREGADETLLGRERVLRQSINAKAAHQARLLAVKQADEKALAQVGRELDALAGELQAVQAQVRLSSPRYAALTQPRTLDLRAIQERVLDRDTVLLEVALGAERSHVWAVTPTGVETHELPPRAMVEALARRYYDELRVAPRAFAAMAVPTDTARALSRLLLEPLAGAIKDARRVVVVADGALLFVPWAALPDPGSAAGRPLVFTREVVSLPSASTLDVIREETSGRTPAPGIVAVVADPVFDAQDPRVRGARLAPASAPAGDDDAATRAALARLIGSRREANAILALVPPGQARSALDFEASRRTVLGPELGRYRIVHLATHGLLDTVRPELSGVVLSLVDRTGREQDGFLRLHDVYNLRWPAELVVLSACQTGLGKEVRGEGLIGLTRGFMYAGARRVVTSLWKVDDRATALLMERFYRAMLGPEKLSPAAALRRAQAHLQSQPRWSAPFYWAGFVLQGEWR